MENLTLIQLLQLYIHVLIYLESEQFSPNKGSNKCGMLNRVGRIQVPALPITSNDLGQIT